jgi:hypothetical protein
VTLTAADGFEARNNLHHIANAWPALHAALRPGSSNALTGMPGTSPERPAPINLHISDLIHEITVETEALAHALMDETDWTPRTSAMPELLLEVAEHYGHWTTADDRTAHNFADWAHDYAGRVRNALARPEPPRYIGPCGIEDANDNPCDGSLYLKPGSAMSRCRTCGAEVEEERQRDWISNEFANRTMTISDIASALVVLGCPIPIKTLQRWTLPTVRTNGKVVDPKLPAQPNGRYRVADARALATSRSNGRISA